MKEPIDGDCLILSGREFQTVGAAKLKAVRPMAVVVKRTCSRLYEEERRSLKGALRLMRDERYEGEPDWRFMYILMYMLCAHHVGHHSLRNVTSLSLVETEVH